MYVPRDESFSEVKQLTFSRNTLYSALHAVIPAVEMILKDTSLGFPLFTDIDQLFDQGVKVPLLDKHEFLKDALPRIVRAISNTADSVLQFETPSLLLSKIIKITHLLIKVSMCMISQSYHIYFCICRRQIFLV